MRTATSVKEFRSLLAIPMYDRGEALNMVLLLRQEPKPARQRIREALAGNLCRCTGYVKIVEAVELAAERTSHG